MQFTYNQNTPRQQFTNRTIENTWSLLIYMQNIRIDETTTRRIKE